MAGKTKHLINRQGNFFARIVVPISLRPIIGKTELREPLGSNRRIAEQNLHSALVGFHAQLDEARRKLPASPTPARKQSGWRGTSIRELARQHYEAELCQDDADRFGDASKIARALERDSRERYEHNLRKLASGIVTDGESAEGFEAATIGWAIDRMVIEGKITIERDSPEWRALARTLAAIQIEALDRSKERDGGNFDGAPKHPLLIEGANVPEPDATPVSILGLLESYLQELARSGKGEAARKRWTPVFGDLTRFLGHDDANRLRKKSVIAWKDHLLETKSPKTVRDTCLASLKAVLQHATDNLKVADNVAAGVRIKFTAASLNRSKGFTPDEAALILKAAVAHKPKRSDNPQTREGAHLTAAKKWVPWFCAMTGARVAEITQLRKEDVRTEGEVRYLRITPEAGSVKSGKYRDVPIHPQIIDLEFLGFVAASADGPLFYAIKPTRAGSTHPSKTVAGRVSQWLNTLGVIPAGVDPSHGWRHRFKTIGREAGIDPRVLDALQGHAARTAGDSYGDVTLKAMFLAICTMPKIDA